MFKLKTWHFILMFALLTILTNAIGQVSLKDSSGAKAKSNLVELNEISLNDSIASGISFVLFYADSSKLCDKMELNLMQIKNEELNNTKFYKLDAKKWITKVDQYNISGVPTILIFENGREISRIMGVTPLSSLHLAHNRTMK